MDNMVWLEEPAGFFRERIPVIVHHLLGRTGNRCTFPGKSCRVMVRDSLGVPNGDRTTSVWCRVPVLLPGPLPAR